MVSYLFLFTEMNGSKGGDNEKKSPITAGCTRLIEGRMVKGNVGYVDCDTSRRYIYLYIISIFFVYLEILKSDVRNINVTKMLL